MEVEDFMEDKGTFKDESVYVVFLYEQTFNARNPKKRNL